VWRERERERWRASESIETVAQDAAARARDGGRRRGARRVAIRCVGTLAIVAALAPGCGRVGYDPLGGSTDADGDAGSADASSADGDAGSADGGASVPTEEATLLASDGAAGDLLGFSVALSADGSRALVGASFDDTSGSVDAGIARVFVRSGSTWTEEATLLASDGAAGDHLGWSVALSADGSRALVGADADDTAGGVDAGSARVFVRIGSTWTEEATLLASDGATRDELGISVALSADGSRALVGAFRDDTAGGAEAGSALVFVRSGSTWLNRAAQLMWEHDCGVIPVVMATASSESSRTGTAA